MTPDAFDPFLSTDAEAAAVDRDGPARVKPGVFAALIRFGVIGVVGTGVNLAVLALLHGVLGLGFSRSSAIATEVAILGNYLGNELWTFHHRKLNLRRLVKFNAVALVGLAITVAVGTVAKEFVNYLLAQFLGICCGALTNFALNFGWTWRR